MAHTYLMLPRSLQQFWLASLIACCLPYNLAGSALSNPQISLTSKPIGDTTLALTVNIQVPAGAHLYRDYLALSVDNPAVTLSDWKASEEARSAYDATFKTTKKIFDRDLTLTLQAERTAALHGQARLHVTYYLSSNKGITKTSFPLPFVEQQKQEPTATTTPTAPVHADTVTPPLTTPPHIAQPTPSISYTEQLSLLISSTNKLWVRLILALLLGTLMSLTPCIYPMIPITVGILQAQGSRSLLRSLLLSLAYTVGIATTFSLLGLAAATTGQMFGAFMANPFVILFIVALLAYLGFAMLGFYEMYVPSFLKSRSNQSADGSLSSAFLFGVASGTVASPCLSPGLVLLLSIVTTLKSTLMGFLLLFMFGVGLSLPLLIIGTFSSSLALLPRAGMWMVEVKKFFGFMLFGMCFYFLKPLLPAPYLLGALALFLLASGLVYLYYENKKRPGVWRSLSGILAIVLIASSIVVASQAYKAYLMIQECTVDCSHWQTNYAHTLTDAQTCSKRLFIDVGASFCSICTAIDKKILAHPTIEAALKRFCCLKIDGANDPDNAIKLLQEKYGVVGFPTFLLIDAQTGTLIKRWGSELYEVDIQAFANELAALAIQ